jgi:hypothetical protein
MTLFPAPRAVKLEAGKGGLEHWALTFTFSSVYKEEGYNFAIL